MIEANDLKRTREAIGDRWRGQVVRVFKSVLLDQVQIVPLVEDLAPHIRVELAEHADFGILFRDQFLAHRGYLDVEDVIGQEEIRREVLPRSTVAIPGDREGSRLVKPGDAVEIQ